MTSPPRRAVLALAVFCVALCPALLAACGGGDEPPTAGELLRETFGTPTSAVKNARMDLDFQLDPEGLLSIGGPIKLALVGPFLAPRSGELPRFNIDLVATLGRQPYSATLMSTGKQAFVSLDGGTYKVDSRFVDRLRSGLRSASSDPRGLQALGIEPLRWISAARLKGDERVSGVDTTRIGGTVNVERLLGDLDRLLTKAGGSAGGESLLPATLRKQIASAVSKATVDLWTGTSDKLLRQLAVKIEFFFELNQSPVQGLNGGTINLRLRLDDVNQTKNVYIVRQTPTRPIARLTGGSITNVFDGIDAGLTGGQGRGLFACITGANGSSSALLRCISKLAP